MCEKKSKWDSARKGQNYTFSYTVTFCHQNIYHSSKVHTQKCAHILKTNDFSPSGFQIAKLQQHYTPFKLKYPNMEVKLKIKNHQIPNLAPHKFS